MRVAVAVVLLGVGLWLLALDFGAASALALACYSRIGDDFHSVAVDGSFSAAGIAAAHLAQTAGPHKGHCSLRVITGIGTGVYRARTQHRRWSYHHPCPIWNASLERGLFLLRGLWIKLRPQAASRFENGGGLSH